MPVQPGVPGGQTQLLANLQGALAGYDFRSTSPATNLGTGSTTHDLTGYGSIAQTASAQDQANRLTAGYAFDGSDDYLEGNSLTLGDFAAADTGLIAVAATATNLSATRTIVAKRTSAASAGSPAGWEIEQVITSGAIRARVADGTTVNSPITATGISAGVRFACALRLGATGANGAKLYLLNTGDSTVYTSTTSRASGTLVTSPSNEFRIGRLSGAGTARFLGTVHQALVITGRTPSDAEVNALLALLVSPV